MTTQTNTMSITDTVATATETTITTITTTTVITVVDEDSDSDSDSDCDCEGDCDSDCDCEGDECHINTVDLICRGVGYLHHPETNWVYSKEAHESGAHPYEIGRVEGRTLILFNGPRTHTFFEL